MSKRASTRERRQGGTAQELRAWKKATTRKTRAALRRLKKHGIAPDDVLSILEQQKRRLIAEARNREAVQAAARLTQTLTGRRAERLLSKIEHGKRVALPTTHRLGYEDLLRRNLGRTTKFDRPSGVPRANPIKLEARGRKTSPALRLLLPLVELFWKRTGKLLPQNAVDLVSAAFPEFKFGWNNWNDPRKIVYDTLKAPKLKDRFEVPPLDEINEKPTRRAAAQILIDVARDDLLDMRVEKLRVEREHGTAAALETTAKVRRPEQSNDHLDDCPLPGCSVYKNEFERLISKQNFRWMMSDDREGWFFRCAKCKRIRHSRCDGLDETSRSYTCRKCARKNLRTL